MNVANEYTLKALTASVVEINSAIQKFNIAFSDFITSLEDAEWMDISRACRLTGLTPRQLRYRAENGVIRSKRNGKNYLFFSEDLMRFRTSNIA